MSKLIPIEGTASITNETTERGMILINLKSLEATVVDLEADIATTQIITSHSTTEDKIVKLIIMITSVLKEETTTKSQKSKNLPKLMTKREGLK